jgi:deoxyribose-phosphate aldolase
LETCLLSKEEIIDGSLLVALAGVDFVKTSTGFSTGGAKLEDVRLMKLSVGDAALVKASGGVRTYPDAKAMVQAGAARIGTSSGLAIVAEEQNKVVAAPAAAGTY